MTLGTALWISLLEYGLELTRLAQYTREPDFSQVFVLTVEGRGPFEVAVACDALRDSRLLIESLTLKVLEEFTQ